MRKLISILLLLLFANPIFATTPPAPKIETTLNIEITKDTAGNLQSAAEAFFKEIEEKKEEYGCNNEENEENETTGFCKKEFSTTKKLINGEITFSNPAKEEDFEKIVAFYNELKTFKDLLTTFEITQNSKKKSYIISEINAILEKLNLNDLIEKLNKENELLNTALKQVEAKNENKIPTTTKIITEAQIQNINKKIEQFTKLKLIKHKQEKIEIPTIPSTEELNNKNETELKEILKNLQELQTRIQNETNTANDNISKLIKENDKNINDALQNLKKAKEEQAKLLSQLGKNKITINNGNDNVENTELDNNFPTEIKDSDSTYQPNKVVTDLTVENIEKETKNVQHNNDLLKKYITELENCKKELNKYTDDINDINNINTLAKCNEKKLEQENIKEQKECIFEQLKQCSNAIESKKISLFGTNSRLKDGNPDGYSYLKESTLSQNCGSKTNPIYGINDDGTKDSILYRLFKPETECKIPGKTIKIISVEEAENKLKTCIGNLTLLNEIQVRCENISPTQKEGTNYINKYITVDKILKKCENGRPLFQGSPTNEINENAVIKQCMNTLKSQKCIEYATDTTEIYKYAFKTSADTTANCQSIIEDTFCQEYATNKNVELISFKPTSTKGTDTKDYSKECKKYVDENILNFTEYENLMREESNLLNKLSSITANDLIKKYAIEKHQCIEGTGGNKRNKLCSNTNIKTKSDLNSTVNIINKNIIKLEEIIENQKKVDDIIAKLNNACTENKELKGYNKDTLSKAIDYIRLNLKCKDGNSPVPENIQNIALKIYEKFNPNQHYSGVNKLTCGNKPQFLRRFSTNPAELLTGAPTCKKE